ncbi:hypothetical protein EGW08_002163, partial [Elysia chlorotica]
ETKQWAKTKPGTDVKIQAPPRTSSEPQVSADATDEAGARHDRPLTREEEERQRGALQGTDNSLTPAGDSGRVDNSPVDNEGRLSSPVQSSTGDAGKNLAGSNVLDLSRGDADGIGNAETEAGGENPDEDEEAEVTVTLRKTDDTKPELPENVQKLLEDSIKKEFKKNGGRDDGSQPLSFDTDHSFQRDRTVHVIQSEDDEGKTNRYIFIFGFNNFNDESAEKQRQSQLEENYEFVYSNDRNDKNKKSLTSGTGS